MSMHHLADQINVMLEDDGLTEEEIITAALDRHVYPILEKTLGLIADIEKNNWDCTARYNMHQVRLLKDEIHDLLQGRFR